MDPVIRVKSPSWLNLHCAVDGCGDQPKIVYEIKDTHEQYSSCPGHQFEVLEHIFLRGVSKSNINIINENKILRLAKDEHRRKEQDSLFFSPASLREIARLSAHFRGRKK